MGDQLDRVDPGELFPIDRDQAPDQETAGRGKGAARGIGMDGRLGQGRRKWAAGPAPSTRPVLCTEIGVQLSGWRRLGVECRVGTCADLAREVAASGDPYTSIILSRAAGFC